MVVVASTGSIITPMLISSFNERVWCILDLDLGPILKACWYRPPKRGEIPGIQQNLCTEFSELRREAFFTVIVGDTNVHHIHR